MDVKDKLFARIREVCPAAIGFDHLLMRIDYAPEATAQQRAAAQAILDAFDPLSAKAEIEAEAAAEAERQAFLKLIKDKWQNEFIPLRNWARMKGYPG